jgi:hypothetical protein
MASIPLVSGGSQPVFATDTLNGSQLSSNQTYTPAGTPVNFAGPALEFYGMDLGSDPSGQAGVNGAIQQILQNIQQQATVAMYQVAATGNATNFSVATYPLGAFGGNAATSATALQAQVRALGNIQITNGGVTTGFDVSTATVTNVGFRLATTATSAS